MPFRSNNNVLDKNWASFLHSEVKNGFTLLATRLKTLTRQSIDSLADPSYCWMVLTTEFLRRERVYE